MRYVLSMVLTVLAASALAAATSYQELTWDDLMPPGEWARYDQQLLEYMQEAERQWIEEGSAEDIAIQFGTYNVVGRLDGQKVRIPGFVLPFEYTGGEAISEFLLVPYFGACLHSPPPPPNQIVYVTTEEPQRFEGLWTPIWAEGTLRTEKHLNGLGDAAYTLHLENWEIYEEDE